MGSHIGNTLYGKKVILEKNALYKFSLFFHCSFSPVLVILDQNQNQNCLLVIRPRTIIHQDLCLGKLVPSPHKRSKLSN